MVDDVFAHPRLAAVYDVFDAPRDDLGAYLAIADDLGPRDVLDLGCGTGVLALLLAAGGMRVVGVDPAAASLDVARGKPGASDVRWVLGDGRDLLRLAASGVAVDLVTMTGNAAMAVVEPDLWQDTLSGVRSVLRPAGRFVFETRDPAYRGWTEWTRDATRRVADVPGEGRVESWTDLVEVALPLVTFRITWVFGSDGATLTSASTLRFRERDEVERDLLGAGFVVEDVRGAPDRPGRELVFMARR